MLRWSGRLSLTRRILAVNIFALAIFAGSLFYLDGYRTSTIRSRLAQAETEARLVAHALAVAPAERHEALLVRMGGDSRTRLRIYGPVGAPLMDSWRSGPRTYTLRDPKAEPWNKDAARLLDRIIDFLVRAETPPPYVPAARESLADWPEAQRALDTRQPASALRLAPEGTPFLSAAAPLADGDVLLATVNARDVRAGVRSQRLTLGFILLATILLSVLLSLFLARTIVRPLRRLARAAVRVRLGRAREVSVPTLPARRDEIGLLARALHDMTQSLRYRIDATEAFAADVTHELKNPLASLRSAVESLERVEEPDLRRQLLEIIRDDVVRLDRLVVDIAEVSRLDAELSRARFEEIDVGRMIESLLAHWDERASRDRVRVAFARPLVGAVMMLGEPSRLIRVLDNIVDNAISFSPPKGLVEIAAAEIDGDVVIEIEDQGAGVPGHVREAIFNRFHSIRPEGEVFGRHSGLGLAIAKAIVEGHDGRIEVGDRHDGRAGARFVLRFPGVATP